MKAVVFKRYGSPDNLEIHELPVPEPGSDEVLVRVHASSVNSWDWEYLNGTPFANRAMFGLFRPKPGKQRLGADIAGVVQSVGAETSRFKPGDEVFGDLWDKWGGFAEFACTGENGLAAKPADLTFEQAAAVPQACVLALGAYSKAGMGRQGHRVLINGAGGGVGTFAIQLAKLDRAEVTGVDAPHKLKKLLELGADHIIDHTVENFTQRSENYDLIIDCRCARPFSDYERVLSPGGVYAFVGGSSLRAMQLLLKNKILPGSRDSKRLHLVMEGPNNGLDYLAKLLEAGKISPVIDRVFSLDKVSEALRYFGENRHIGKIGLSM